MFDEFGLKNCKIELIETCNVEDDETLRKREEYYIKQYDCVNKMVYNDMKTTKKNNYCNAKTTEKHTRRRYKHIISNSIKQKKHFC